MTRIRAAHATGSRLRLQRSSRAALPSTERAPGWADRTRRTVQTHKPSTYICKQSMPEAVLALGGASSVGNPQSLPCRRLRVGPSPLRARREGATACERPQGVARREIHSWWLTAVCVNTRFLDLGPAYRRLIQRQRMRPEPRLRRLSQPPLLLRRQLRHSSPSPRRPRLLRRGLSLAVYRFAPGAPSAPPHRAIVHHHSPPWLPHLPSFACKTLLL